MKWFKCVKCGQKKTENNFYNDKHKPSGKKPRCKGCDLLSRDKTKRAEYEKEYWGKRRERRREIIINSYNPLGGKNGTSYSKYK